MQITKYKLQAINLETPMKVALITDLHNRFPNDILQALKAELPNLILIAGDLLDDVAMRKNPAPALDFLKNCVAIAPTFYSLGNHEIACYHKGNPFRHPTPKAVCDEYRNAVKNCGTILLDNDCVLWNHIWICGLSSGIDGKKNEPNKDALKKFSALSGKKILLCHHPEYYPFLSPLNFDLTVCGHAHGGHWRIFGHGIYAPGQGLFPKYTSGVLKDNFVISRGLGDHTKIPRIFNQKELVLISLTKK